MIKQDIWYHIRWIVFFNIITTLCGTAVGFCVGFGQPAPALVLLMGWILSLILMKQRIDELDSFMDKHLP